MNFTFDFEDIFTNDNEGNTSIWDTFSDNIHNVHDTLYDSIHDLYETFINSTEMKFEPNSNSWWNLAVIIMIVEIVIGFFGNVLSLIVWNRGKECCKMACSTYFKILASSDILTLISFLIGIVIPHFFDISETSYCGIIGRISAGLIPFAPQLSAWVIVSIALERMLSICFPFRFRKEGFRRRAWIACIVIIVVLLGLNYKTYICSSFVTDNVFGISLCICIDESSGAGIQKVSIVWFLCILPLVFMISCNIVILAKLFMIRKSRQRLNSSNRQSRQGTFNKLCISASLLHCVSVLPLTFMAYFYFELFTSDKTDNLYAIYNVFNNIAALFPNNIVALFSMSIALFILNNSLNFLIYCFSGRNFRSDLKEMVFTCKCRSMSGSSERQLRWSTG
jgi:hypothetical protein